MTKPTTTTAVRSDIDRYARQALTGITRWAAPANVTVSQSPNAFHGVDVFVYGARGAWVVRLAAEFADLDEGIDLISLTGNGVCRWQVHFHGVPTTVIAAAVEQALFEAADRANGSV